MFRADCSPRALPVSLPRSDLPSAAHGFAMRRSAAAVLTALTLAAAPADAQRAGTGTLLAGAGALVAGAVLLDRPVERMIPEGGGSRYEWATDRLNHGGRPSVALVALGGTYIGARLADKPRVSSAAVHVTAALLASGLANGALKVGVGRERPSETDDPFRFRPFNTRNRWQAFPSGHSTVAFSLATAVSEEADRPWVTAAAYTGASLVAWSRVYEDKHWTSDVVAGALIGIGASHATLRAVHGRHPHEDGGARITLAPGGIAVSIATR